MSLSAGKDRLVTGASGFIGAAVALRLREAGAVVHGVSRQVRTSLEEGLRRTVDWYRRHTVPAMLAALFHVLCDVPWDLLDELVDVV